MHFHIKDCIEHVPPGGVVRAVPNETLDFALARLVGVRIARTILDTVGENGVLTLSETELASTAGISRAAARRIVAARDVGNALADLAFPRASSVGDAMRVLPQGLKTLEIEVLLGIALDGQLSVRAVLLLGKGGAHGTALSARDLFMPLVRVGATGVILVHNHPSGDPTPSREDIVFTNHASRAGELLGIQLVDHLVVAHRGTTSFREAGLILTESELAGTPLLHENGGAP